MGKVYIAKGGELYKFGNSEKPDARLKQLQTGSPVPLELVYTFDAKTPKRAETELKRMFAAKHSHGEWFRLTEADVLSVKQATTDVPASAPPAPQAPAGAATGALKALTDIWASRYYLLLLIVIGVPLYVAYETYVLETPAPGYVLPTRAATAQSLSATMMPVVTAVPLAGPMVPVPPPPVVEVQAEPTIAQLIPINDATAEALGGIPVPEGNAPQWPVTWPATRAPTENPIQVVRATVDTFLADTGVEPLAVTVVTPRGYWGHKRTSRPSTQERYSYRRHHRWRYCFSWLL